MGASTIVTSFGGAVLALAGLATPSGRIVVEWDPGLTEAEVGGELVVDGYGIDGLGVYVVRLDDGSTYAAVCVQADVGHSLSAEYTIADGGGLAPELAYLAWAHLSSPTLSDVQAAAINLLAWRYTDARRRTGGPVWHGEGIEVRALGVGRLVEVEEAAAALHVEATARRGPWTLTGLTTTDGTASVGVTGPGGPIVGVPVTFGDGGGWATVGTSGPDGRATVVVPAGVASVEVRAEGPGEAIVLAAPGSQRLAAAGPSVVLTALAVVPTTTTTSTTTTSTSTTSTTSTSSTTTTTTAPPTTPTPASSTTTSTTPTTVPVTTTTTTTTTPPPVSSTLPPPPTTGVPPPPTIPVTGTTSRGLTRVGAALFAAGSAAVLAATRRPPRRTRAGL